MSRTIVLVACVAQKASSPCSARELYRSAWFTKAAAYADRVSDAWYILSAKHGVLHPLRVIAPYNETLNTMPATQRCAWAGRVMAVLEIALDPGDRVVILAGQKYRQYLVAPLREYGCEVDIPMAGLRIGEQLHWLNAHL